MCQGAYGRRTSPSFTSQARDEGRQAAYHCRSDLYCRIGGSQRMRDHIAGRTNRSSDFYTWRLQKPLRFILSPSIPSTPDLLTKGEFERMAVGVGNPRRIANGFAKIDGRACWPALAARLCVQPIDLLPARAGDAEMSKRPERMVLLACGLDQHDNEGSGVVGKPDRADSFAGAAVYDGHPRIFCVKRDACIEIASGQRDVGQPEVRNFKSSPFSSAYYSAARSLFRSCSPPEVPATRAVCSRRWGALLAVREHGAMVDLCAKLRRTAARHDTV